MNSNQSFFHIVPGKMIKLRNCETFHEFIAAFLAPYIQGKAANNDNVFHMVACFRANIIEGKKR